MPDPTPGAAPEPAPDQDRRKISAPLNGLKGGCPPGQRPKINPPTPEETEALIEHAAAAVLSGKSIRNARAVSPISDEDRRYIARLTNMTADEFTARLGAKLRTLADKTADRINQKLDADQFRPHELSFLLTVGVDKLQRLEGKGQLTGANVAIQINNFAPGQSKADIIARLTGQTIDLPPATSTPAPHLAVAEEQAQYAVEPDPAPSLPPDESPD